MRRILNYIPTVLAAGLIMYLSLLREPHLRFPEIEIAYADKWVHMVMYLILGALTVCDLSRDNVRPKLAAAIAIVLPSLYGGGIELLQEYFFPPRTGEWLDWAADIAGVVIGAGVALICCRCRRRREAG